MEPVQIVSLIIWIKITMPSGVLCTPDVFLLEKELKVFDTSSRMELIYKAEEDPIVIKIK